MKRVVPILLLLLLSNCSLFMTKGSKEWCSRLHRNLVRAQDRAEVRHTTSAVINYRQFERQYEADCPQPEIHVVTVTPPKPTVIFMIGQVWRSPEKILWQIHNITGTDGVAEFLFLEQIDAPGTPPVKIRAAQLGDWYFVAWKLPEPVSTPRKKVNVEIKGISIDVEQEGEKD